MDLLLEKSYPQVLNECDSSGLNFHVNLLDDCYVVIQKKIVIEGFFSAKIKYRRNV